MFERTLPSELIERLKTSRFWQNICGDTELQPEVRRDAVTVYYQGGALVRELRLDGGELLADVHQKFVPLLRTEGPTNIRLRGSGDGGMGFIRPPEPLPLGQADALTLKTYKDMMAIVLAPNVEGLLQQAIVSRSENAVLDQEIAFQESGESRDKIDLCHYDGHLRKLIFVELKHKDDSRLFKPLDRPEVLEQLEAYGRRLHTYRQELTEAYRRVAGWKRDLGLGGRLASVPTDGVMDLLEKPILVIGNCYRDDVPRIRNGDGEWAVLRRELPNVAAGLILCGKDGCRLGLAAGPQCLTFLA